MDRGRRGAKVVGEVLGERFDGCFGGIVGWVAGWVSDSLFASCDDYCSGSLLSAEAGKESGDAVDHAEEVGVHYLGGSAGGRASALLFMRATMTEWVCK